MDNNLYLIGGIVTIIIIVAMVIMIINNGRDEKKKKIMDAIGASSGNNKKNIVERKKDEIAKKLQDSKGDKVTIQDKINQAGLEISVGQFWMLSFASMFVLLVLTYFWGAPPIAYPLIAIIGLLGVPRLVIGRIISKRQTKFLESFSDALDSMVRMLKAGMPPTETIHMVSKEFEGPLGEEMSRVYDAQKMGIPMNEAVAKAADRMPLPEMRMFATGMSIQQETGASLSEVLTNLSALIRARFRLQRKVQALSAEAKASASIIGALPILVATGLYFINKEYIELLFTVPTGQKLLAGAILWMGVGIMIMKQMINFKV